VSLIDWLRGRRGRDETGEDNRVATDDLIRQMREQAQIAKLQEYMIRGEAFHRTWLEDALIPRTSDEKGERQADGR
jgi:hypothetical protein